MAILENSSSYSLTDQFTSKTEEAVASSLKTFEPGEGANEQLILGKLGVNGWGRLQYFRMCFAGGWGEGHENPLSPRSQEMFLKALAVMHFPPGAKPSLFLTDEGFLELTWRDSEDRAVQIEFGANEFEIYIEATAVECTFPNHQLEQVIRQYFGG